jgi:hypothetical protein
VPLDQGRLVADLGALDGRDVLRRRQVPDHRVQQRLHALVLEGAAAQHRGDPAGDGGAADRLAQLLDGRLLLGDVLLQQALVVVGEQLEQPVPPLLGQLLVLVGDRPVLPGLAHAVARPVVAAHLDQVDDAVEVALDAPGQLQHRRGRPQPVHDHVDGAVELGPDPVHLVDEADPRHPVGVGLAPDRLRLGLHAADRVEHGHGAVEHAQGALDLDGEVDVAGRVDQVDPVVAPLAGGGGRGDGDAALLLLLHPVHDRGALMDLAHLVGAARVVQDALGRGGLAGVDVGHDPDVARARQRELADREPTLGRRRGLAVNRRVRHIKLFGSASLGSGGAHVGRRRIRRRHHR